MTSSDYREVQRGIEVGVSGIHSMYNENPMSNNKVVETSGVEDDLMVLGRFLKGN
jgi:hypothetical protein